MPLTEVDKRKRTLRQTVDIVDAFITATLSLEILSTVLGKVRQTVSNMSLYLVLELSLRYITSSLNLDVEMAILLVYHPDARFPLSS